MFHQPTPDIRAPLENVLSNLSQKPQYYVHDGCSHLFQVRNRNPPDGSPTQLCIPYAFSFNDCGHYLEYHCTVGRSFQAGEVHNFCTFNLPPMAKDLNKAGYCPQCRKSIEEHEELLSACGHNKSRISLAVSHIWKRITSSLTVVVNMHSYPATNWTSSSGTHRFRRYHCKECKRDDAALREMLSNTERGVRRAERRQRLAKMARTYSHRWDIGA
ncbi:hypothetical protein GLAREA_09655 [Glarea lozoyensis ATCC 20868]|uniref:Uncharacterized protein n=1 Tax=Glarea lozoyensis (strain ATCC 20868 / MF5171) TaxID=1116229 RepID=S3CU29_GLAL2|nr:uncharacterized protein GLAREA_09655 [Glarea lozoyensis ATCC 20868]EPE28534.1 hypothetical protein GLAREA_09655 [Glarea lozoyensis ATCC 20868]